MKVLFIYCKKFGYTATVKTVESVPDNKNVAKYYENIQTAFIHVEEEDVVKDIEVEKKLVKNLKWICGKNKVKKVVLHSFVHLSESKAEHGFTMKLFNNNEERMKNAGYEVHQTPFGYFLDLVLGFFMLLLTGFGYILIIKGEYYFGVKFWPLFLK